MSGLLNVIRSFSRRESYIFALTLGMVVVYLIMMCVWRPLRKRVRNVQEEITLYENKLQKYQAVLNAGRQKSDFKNYSENFKQKESDEKEMSLFLSEIERAARSFKISLSDIKPGQVERGEFYNRFLVKLSFENELISIIRFIDYLQQAQYFIKVVEIQLERYNQSKYKCSLVFQRIFFLE